MSPTFLDEMKEPETAVPIELARLAAFKHSMLLWQGGQGAPFLAVVLDRVAAALQGRQFAPQRQTRSRPALSDRFTVDSCRALMERAGQVTVAPSTWSA